MAYRRKFDFFLRVPSIPTGLILTAAVLPIVALYSGGLGCDADKMMWIFSPATEIHRCFTCLADQSARIHEPYADSG